MIPLRHGPTVLCTTRVCTGFITRVRTSLVTRVCTGLLPIALLLAACAFVPPSAPPTTDAPVRAGADQPVRLQTEAIDAEALSATGVLTSPVRRYLPLLPRRTTPQLELVAQIGGQAHGLAGIGDRLYYLRGGSTVVLDASAQDEPQEIDQGEALPLPASRLSAVRNGALLLAYGERALMLLDVDESAGAAPTLLASLELPERAHAFTEDLGGNLLWVATAQEGLLAIDISNPSAPRIVGKLPARGETVDVTVRGTLAYVVDRKAGLLVIDIADPTAPRELGRFDDDGDARSVLLVDDHLAYVSTTHRFWVVDISDPHRPRKVWQPKELPGPEGPVEVATGGRLSRVGNLVLLHGHRLLVLDTRDPPRPSVAAFVRDVDGGSWVGAGPLVSAAGSWWAGGPGEEESWELLRFTTDVPDAPGRLQVASRSRLPGPLALWWPTFQPGLRQGTMYYGPHRLDITDPPKVHRLGEAGFGADWAFALDRDRKLAITTNTASLSDTLAVWDLQDPAAPRHVASLRGRTDSWGAPWYASEIALAGDVAFVAGGWGGWGCPVFAVVDLSDPGRPRELGFLEDISDQHNYCQLALREDAHTVLAVDCGHRCDTLSEGGPGRLDLLDVSDPSAPVLSARARTEHEAYDIALSAGVAFVAVGPRGLEVFNVQDPQSPQRIGALAVGDFIRWIEPIGDGFLVLGDRGALHVVDVREPERPVLVRTQPVAVRDELGGLAYVDGHLWVGGREAGLLGYRVTR